MLLGYFTCHLVRSILHNVFLDGLCPLQAIYIAGASIFSWAPTIMILLHVSEAIETSKTKQKTKTKQYCTIVTLLEQAGTVAGP